MEKKFANTISIVFHPLLLPTYALLLLFTTNYYFVMILPVNYRFLLLGFVFITSFVLPAIMMFLLLHAKMIGSLRMENKNERTLPLLIVAAFFFATFYFLRKSPQASVFNVFMLGSTILILIASLINYFTKISIHMLAHGGMNGAFLGLAITFSQNINYILFSIIFIAGLTAYARLKLNAHSPKQVYLGYLVGFVFMSSLFYFLQ